MMSKEFGIFSCFRPLLNLTLDRKDKIEVLDKKRCLTIPDRDPTTGLEDEETVFSACIVPTELYGELISSYSATSVVDLSPAQEGLPLSSHKVFRPLWHRGSLQAP